jgi:ankyrin repeat protein
VVAAPVTSSCRRPTSLSRAACHAAAWAEDCEPSREGENPRSRHTAANSASALRTSTDIPPRSSGAQAHSSAANVDLPLPGRPNNTTRVDVPIQGRPAMEVAAVGGSARATHTQMAAAAASSEGASSRPTFTAAEARRMLASGCSLEAFQERMLSSEINVALFGEELYKSARRPEQQSIRMWFRSAEFASRVGAIEWRDPLEVFLDACKEGDEEYVSRLSSEDPALLDKGCEVRGLSLWHAASMGGFVWMLSRLPGTSTRFDLPDGAGMTPLMYALFHGHEEAAEHLMRLGANVGVRSRSGRSTLHGACWGGSTALVERMLRLGLDVNATDEERATPLHFASQLGHVDVVTMLLRHGADLEAEDSSGWTALSEALRNGKMGVVECLLSAGASLDNVHAKSWPIEQTAISCGLVPVMEFLLSKRVVRVSRPLIEGCIHYQPASLAVLRYVLLLYEESDTFASVALLPQGFLGRYASVSEWRRHERRMDLRWRMLSWRRGFVVSRLDA